MRHIIRVITHMIVSASFLLFFANRFESSLELAVYSLITMLLAAFLYGLRNKAKKLWLLLGCHFLLLLGGSFLILIIGAYYWYIAIWCLWVLYSVVLRIVPAAESLDTPRFSYVTVLGIEYLSICVLDGSVFAQRLSLIATVLVFLLYILYRNLESMDRFILVGSFSNKVDEQGIRKLNNRLSLLYAGILGALLVVFSLFRIDGLWNTVMSWIRSIWYFLVRLIPLSEQVQPEKETEVEHDVSNMVQEIAQEGELSVWMRWIGEIIHGIIAFTIVAVIVVVIVRVAIIVYRHFYKKKDCKEGDKVIEALTFGDRITKERKPRFFERFERTPARRIRRIYKNSLKRVGAKSMSAFSYMSPDEQVQHLRTQGLPEEAIDEIKYLYEKARYSKGLVTDAEVEQMRHFYSNEN